MEPTAHALCSQKTCQRGGVQHTGTVTAGWGGGERFFQLRQSRVRRGLGVQIEILRQRVGDCCG